MLDLVAEAAGGQALVLHLKIVAVAVLCPHPDNIGTGHDAVFTRHAQTALQPGLFALGGDDLRVDELNDLVVLVHHHAHPAQHAHLGRRQAHAAAVHQRLCHVVQQRVESGIEIRHHPALLGQTLVSLYYDLPQSHVDPSQSMRLQSVKIVMFRFSFRRANSFINAAIRSRRIFSFRPITVTR